MRFNELASQIAEQEGLSKQVSIGNVRELLRLTLTILANLPAGELGELLAKYQKKWVKYYMSGVLGSGSTQMLMLGDSEYINGSLNTG